MLKTTTGILLGFHHLASGKSTFSRSSHLANFLKYLFFSSRSPFFKTFPGGYLCSSNRYQISRSLYLFVEQITIIQEPVIYVRRTDSNFPGRPICLISVHFLGIPFFNSTFSFCYRTADIKFSGDLFSFVIT